VVVDERGRGVGAQPVDRLVELGDRAVQPPASILRVVVH
jgi:hypothetical protein